MPKKTVSRTLLPALRRLALFPKKSVEIVSTETMCELTDLLDYVEEHGRPTPADIERLEDDNPEPVVIVPKSQSPRSARPAAPQVLKATAAAAIEAPSLSEFDRKGIKVCQRLLEREELSEWAAARDCDVLSGSWAYFKCKNNWSGRPTRNQLVQFLAKQGVHVPEPAQPPAAVPAKPKAPAAVDLATNAPSDYLVQVLKFPLGDRFTLELSVRLLPVETQSR